MKHCSVHSLPTKLAAYALLMENVGLDKLIFSLSSRLTPKLGPEDLGA